MENWPGAHAACWEIFGSLPQARAWALGSANWRLVNFLSARENSSTSMIQTNTWITWRLSGFRLVNKPPKVEVLDTTIFVEENSKLTHKRIVCKIHATRGEFFFGSPSGLSFANLPTRDYQRTDSWLRSKYNIKLSIFFSSHLRILLVHGTCAWPLNY